MSDQKQERGTVFLHPSIWTAIAAVAAADGVPPSEELRACVLEGLRTRQQKLRTAGVSIDRDTKADTEAIALIKALAEKKEPSPDAVAVIAKQLNMAPHTLLSKLKSKEGNGAESRVTH